MPHPLLAGCTVSGLPLLWPAPRRLLALPRALRIATGSAAETGVMRLLALACAALLLPLLISPAYA